MKNLLIAVSIFTLAILFEGCTSAGLSVGTSYGYPWSSDGYPYYGPVYYERYFNNDYYLPQQHSYGIPYHQGPGTHGWHIHGRF